MKLSTNIFLKNEAQEKITLGSLPKAYNGTEIKPAPWLFSP